jgi:hypothetical protein
MGYPTTAELVEGSSSSELQALTAEQQDALRASAIVAVEAHCGQSFTQLGSIAEPHTIRVDGTGSNRLWLPQRLSSLLGLAASGASFSEADAVVDRDRQRLVVGADAYPARNYYEKAMEAISGAQGWVFPEGALNVAIAGIWGWTDEEYEDELAAVTAAIRLDMEEAAAGDASHLAETVRTARALGISALSQGRLSIELRAGAGSLGSGSRRLLAGRSPGGFRYRWRAAQPVAI